MIDAPPQPQEVERARAQVGGEAERIYDETRRQVDDEIARLDAARVWAEGEMDRITAQALADLDAGRDPDAVERKLQSDLAAVISRAQDPGFDPRTLAPTRSAAPAPAVAPTPATPPPITAAPKPAPAPPPPIAAASPEPPAVLDAPTPASDDSCRCRVDAVAPPPWCALAWLGVLRRRGPRQRTGIDSTPEGPPQYSRPRTTFHTAPRGTPARTDRLAPPRHGVAWTVCVGAVVSPSGSSQVKTSSPSAASEVGNPP